MIKNHIVVCGIISDQPFIARTKEDSAFAQIETFLHGNPELNSTDARFPVGNGKLIKPQPLRGGVGKPRVSKEETAGLPASTCNLYREVYYELLYSIQIRFPLVSASQSCRPSSVFYTSIKTIPHSKLFQVPAS